MPSNQAKSRLRLRDMRDLSMLVGECRALGGDGIRWRQHLVIQIRQLLDADMAFMTLPLRMLQVLACLLEGLTVKEAAKKLGISAHTVQEYVKRLYKRTGTTNRAELAKFYRPFASNILELTLEDSLLYQKKLDQAIREPWPAKPGPACEQQTV